MLITQAYIAAFTLRVITNLVKATPLSEEQANDLLRREQNGSGRKKVLKLLAAQVDNAVKTNCDIQTRLGKGLSANLLDPEVSALCLVYPFVCTSFLDEPFSSAHTTTYVSIRTQPLFSCKYIRPSRSKCTCAHTDGYCEIHPKSYWSDCENEPVVRRAGAELDT